MTYSVSNVTGDLAWPCISGDDSQLKLTLYSNSSLVYRVRTTPPCLETPRPKRVAMVAVLVLGPETAGKPLGLGIADKVTNNFAALDCISSSAVASASQDPVELVKATLTCVQNLGNTGLQLVIGTLLSGISVLASMIQGIWSELTGTNEGTFTITATAAPPSYRDSVYLSIKVLEDQIAAAGC